MQEINSSNITDRELFIYISTSLAMNPLLGKMDKTARTVILKKVVKEMGITYISNGDVTQIMQTIELFREKLGLALNKSLSVDELTIIREQLLSSPDVIKQSMKMIEENPSLISKIQKVLSEK